MENHQQHRHSHFRQHSHFRRRHQFHSARRSNQLAPHRPKCHGPVGDAAFGA